MGSKNLGLNDRLEIGTVEDGIAGEPCIGCSLKMLQPLPCLLLLLSRLSKIQRLERFDHGFHDFQERNFIIIITKFLSRIIYIEST